MADTPEDRAREALARRIPAYALLRATVANDQDAAVLLVRDAAKAGPPTSSSSTWPQWPPAPSSPSEGYDMAKVLRTLDALDGHGRQRRALCPGRQGQGRSMTAPGTERSATVAEEALAAVALIRAYTARDLYTADRILARWATKGNGLEFAAMVASSAAYDPDP